MKKKTVITTEMHEVWVIRQPGEVSAEETKEHQEPKARGQSLLALPEYHPDYEPDKDEPEPHRNQ